MGSREFAFLISSQGRWRLLTWDRRLRMLSLFQRNWWLFQRAPGRNHELKWRRNPALWCFFAEAHTHFWGILCGMGVQLVAWQRNACRNSAVDWKVPWHSGFADLFWLLWRVVWLTLFALMVLLSPVRGEEPPEMPALPLTHSRTLGAFPHSLVPQVAL